VIHGYRFTQDELEQLGNPPEIKAAEIQNLHLTYLNGEPIFAEGEKVGQQVSVSFGTTGTDISYSAVNCYIDLQRSKDGWIVTSGEIKGDLRYSPCVNIGQKISELVEEINKAICHRQYFDFRDWIDDCKTCDEEFTAGVSYINSYR
jgi:hypothetical protein